MLRKSQNLLAGMKQKTKFKQIIENTCIRYFSKSKMDLMHI